MERRTFMKMGAGAAAFALLGHEPARADLELDALGRIYRQFSLFVVGQRDDETAFALAESVADVLAAELPASRAQVARAADARRVGLLIGTGQRDVAIMAADNADALFLGKRPYDDIGGVPLRLIVSFEGYVLVCRSDFANSHAYQLARTLVAGSDALPIVATAPRGSVPAHPGSSAFFGGRESIPDLDGAGRT